MPENPEEINIKVKVNNTDNTLPSSVPPSGYNNGVKFFLAFIIVLIVAAGLIVYGYYKNTKKVANQLLPNKATTQKTYPFTIGQIQSAMLAHAQIIFPNVSNMATTTQAQLPAAISNFITSSASMVKVQTVNYVNGSSGFNITYKLKDISVQNFSRQLFDIANANKFQELDGQGRPEFAFKEFANSLYKMRISIVSNIEASTTDVTIMALSLK